MKKIQIVLLLLLTILISCRKNFSDETFTPITNPVKPDLTVKVTASISGYITDENKNPVFNARIVAGNKETTTDGYGFFSIEDALFSKAAGLVQVSQNNYFTAYETFNVTDGKKPFVRVQLIPKTITGSVSSAAGGTVTTSDAASIQLPANAAVIAAGNSPYSGNIKVAAKWIDPVSAANLQASTPGDGRALDENGHLVFARAYSTVAVELTGDADQALQIAAGKKATISLPIPATVAGTAPSTIALWSYDPANGFWKQESTAVKTGSAYVGEVSHFSYWAAAVGYPLVDFTARVLNTSLQPLSNVPVMITQANMPQNAGYGRFEYTDANGYVSGPVPANSNLVLDVLTTCATTAYSIPFTTTNSAIDMGAVTGNMGQSLVTIAGTAVNCNNAPITNGYVQTYDNGFYNRIPVINGSFSFTGLACTNTTASYVVVDNSTNQQSQPQTITLIAGVNNLGQLSACGTSTISVINYTIDGTSYMVTEPAQKPGAYLTQNTFTNIISNLNATTSMTFTVNGGSAIGSAHTVAEVFSTDFAGGRAYAPVPLTVNITEYGAPGGFVSGNFSGMMLDFVSNAIYNVSFNFRVKRYH